MTTPKVTLAYVHSNELAVSFHESLLALVMHDGATDRYLAHPAGKIAVKCATNGLVACRNAAAQTLVESDADWLCWIDTDMGFEPDTLSRLMAAADPIERPIVGALCFASREVGSDGMGGHRTLPRPTIYDWVPGPDGVPHFQGRVEYPVGQLVRCAATGSAAVLIHRSVFERVSKMLVEHGQPSDTWYDRIPAADGQLAGEDISFCMRAGICDIPIFVDTRVKTSHLKPMWLGEQHYWAQMPATPATERTAVIVPVLGRPQHAEPFMRSLRASTGLATVYAICQRGERGTAAAWRSAGAEVIYSDAEQVIGGDPSEPPAAIAHTFAEKVNLGYRQTSEPWLFLVGSDVHFWPGWLDHAQHTAAVYGAKVVGTNDLANPAVLAGEHATHLLIARDYVDELGASWDGPGVVCHEGYRHQYVDDELVTVAKQRGVWAMALGSRVEHFHPYAGKGEWDDVYQAGHDSGTADYARFKQRVATHGA